MARSSFAMVALMALLVGAALLVGPAIAQEMTDDGMDDENATDGSMATETDRSMDGDGDGMSDDGVMDDGTTTDDGMSDEGDDAMTDDGLTDGESTTGDVMAGDDTMADGSMTENEVMDDGSGGSDETTAGGQPGLGLIGGVVALLAVAGYALYRRSR